MSHRKRPPCAPPTPGEAAAIAQELEAIQDRVERQVTADADLGRLLTAVEDGLWPVVIGGEFWGRRRLAPDRRGAARALAVRAVADRGGRHVRGGIAWRSDGRRLWAELP